MVSLKTVAVIRRLTFLDLSSITLQILAGVHGIGVEYTSKLDVGLDGAVLMEHPLRCVSN
jgi:hypothetical protein